MARKSIRLALAILGAGTLACAQDIAASAGSPYDLANFVNTHADFDWGPLSKALHIHDESIFLPDCDQHAPCSSELIRVAAAHQLIVLLEHEDSHFQVYLRYKASDSGRWRFSGAYWPYVKYYRPEHRISQFGSKPFLVVTGQGASGTGVASKIQSWIDLTGSEFSPVFDFTSGGQSYPFPKGIGRKTRGAVISLVTDPLERITVAYRVEFVATSIDEKEVPLVHRSDRVVYARTPKGDFAEDEGLSTATARQVEEFYDIAERPYSGEDFIRFNFNGLVAIAASKDNKRRAWLSDFLRHSPHTPDEARLSAILF